MPIAYTIHDPYQWDGLTRSAMSEQGRRDSLITALSAFEVAMVSSLPPRQEAEDVDPFAPISLEDGFHTTKFHLNYQERPQQSSLDRVLSDRSESSGTSAPSLTSSASGSQASYRHPHQGISLSVEAATQNDDFFYAQMDSFSSPSTTLGNSFSTSNSDVSLDEDAEEVGPDNQRFKRFHEEKWSHRYKELLTFHREHGHSAVPHTFPSNPQLARWVKRQRRQYKLRRDGRPSTMTLERLQLLDTVGFVWDSHDVNWREKLSSLDSFRRDHGHCNVPSNYVDKKLATWVKCQRRQYKLYVENKPSAMTDCRIEELERRGFEWEIRTSSSKARASTYSDLA